LSDIRLVASDVDGTLTQNGKFSSDFISTLLDLSRLAKETCECPDPRLFLGRQRQFANLQKKSGILIFAF